MSLEILFTLNLPQFDISDPPSHGWFIFVSDGLIMFNYSPIIPIKPSSLPSGKLT